MYRFCIAALLLLSFPAHSEANDVVAYATEDNLVEYRGLVKSNPGFMHNDRLLNLQLSQRIQADIHIFSRAIAVVGSRLNLKLKPELTDFNNSFQMLKQGRIVAFTETFSRSDISPEDAKQLYISQPVLRQGDYSLGLYSSSINATTLASGVVDLSQLSGVTNRVWQTDWNLLNSLNLNQVYDAPTMEAIFKMVAKGEADLFLFSFQNRPDFSFTRDGHKYLPIPGIKAIFPDARHFAVSRRHLQGKTLFALLEGGLSVMRDGGEINRIYRRFGVIDSRVDDWLVLNKIVLNKNGTE